MVVGVGYIKVAVLVDRDTFRSVRLGVGISPAAPGRFETAIQIKLLDTPVLAVTYIDIPRIIYGQSVGKLEFAVVFAKIAPLALEGAVAIETQYPLVLRI